MPPEVDTSVPAAPAEAEAPAVILTPQDATAEHIARGLSPEQAKAFRAQRKEKKAKAAAAAAAVAVPVVEAKVVPVPATPATTDEAESISFDTPEETPAVSPDETPV